MSLRRLGLGLLVSTVGFVPAALVGQSAQTPRSFSAGVDGRDVIVRWIGTEDAEAYLGQIDGDPDFDSPRNWAVRDDGRRAYEHRIRDLASGTYYVRVRAVERHVIIRRDSDWSHVQRVVVGGGNDPLRRTGGRVIGASTNAPRDLRADLDGNDLVLAWPAVRDANGYVLQIDDDRRFRDPYAFAVDATRDRGVQRYRVRDVPWGRWYVRVRVVDSFVSRGGAWSDVHVVDVGRNWATLRRENDLADGRLAPDVHRRHPVFEEHPGRGKAKGHVKHEEKRGRGHDDD